MKTGDTPDSTVVIADETKRDLTPFTLRHAEEPPPIVMPGGRKVMGSQQTQNGLTDTSTWDYIHDD